MLIAHPKSYLTVMVISGLFLLAGLGGIAAYPQLELAVFALVMLLTGIPHGATDHLIYSSLNQKPGHTIKWGPFLGLYLLTMTGYSLIWWWLPGISLVIFLVISAYHFGQSQVIYIRWDNFSVKKRLLNVSWGAFVLSALLLSHLEEVLLLLSSMISMPPSLSQLSSGERLLFIAIPGGVTLGLWLLALWQGVMSRQEFLREIMAIILLVLVFRIAGLWMGFALYFGIWHAGSSMAAEIRQFQRAQRYSWRAFFRDALPFSLISLIGIALLGVAGWLYREQVPLIMLFFIAISVLTLPHTLYMDRFYRAHPPHENLREAQRV